MLWSYKNIIVIEDDIMIIGKQQNHRDHDHAFTTLLNTPRCCNVRLNYEKVQYKKEKVNFLGETYTTSGHKPAQSKEIKWYNKVYCVIDD